MEAATRDTGSAGIVSFYLRQGGGPRGLTFDRVLQLSDQDLERRHDYIQWIFPTFQRSEAVPESPTLSVEDALELRASPEARQRAMQALVRMLTFYGMALEDDPEEPTIGLSSELFRRRRQFWLTPGNHNYRRITRMLTSLQILGCALYAKALFDCLEVCYRECGGMIGPQAMGHWQRAVGARKL